ncbi:hypothetical protein OUZ56_004393 [Daphnia magna]|uniref:Uncharacterized protein n=1 Tax=Daphnia magna TaxID=35525 RepID=A0ABQ9YPN0_9CRUS|nr:hypothetical protein OUZ56_004393 [Daphnia magna]
MRERSMRVSHGQKENQEENFGEYAQQFYNDFLALAFPCGLTTLKPRHKGAGRIFLCIIQPHDEPLTTEKRTRQPDAG